MFAVIRTGGKQYRVAANETLQIERLKGETGETVTFGEVLVLGGDTPKLGAPLVSGASVLGEIVAHTRGRKIIVFKKRRRQNSKRKNGHRQDYTLVRITDILADGEKPARSAKAEPKAEKAGKAEAKAAAAVEAEAAEAEVREAEATAADAGATKAAAPKKPRAPRKPKSESAAGSQDQAGGTEE